MLVTLAICVITSPLAIAGYEEYTLLDFSACKSYTLTTEWGNAQFKTEDEFNQWYKDDEPTLKMLHDDSWESWALLDIKIERSTINYITEYMGICNWGEKVIRCDGLRSYPLSGLSCPLGHGITWSRACKIHAPSQRNIRIYGVDTGEHEDGSNISENSYFIRDFSKFKAQCKARYRSSIPPPVLVSQSLHILQQKLVADQAYGKYTENCVSYFSEARMKEYDKVPLETIVVKNSCDSQSYFPTFLATFLVNPESSEIFWLDNAKVKLVPYHDWLAQQQKNLDLQSATH